MEATVGFGFRPTDDELAGYYLLNKILGNTCLVEQLINEVDIYSFDPWDLRLFSKLKSTDNVWYFFCAKTKNGDRQRRKTKSGFWKITGVRVEVKDRLGKWCGIEGVIGYKRVLVFHKGKTPKLGKTDWVIHEYHLTKEEATHVLCRVEYKGNDKTFLSDTMINATQPGPSFVHQLSNSAASVATQFPNCLSNSAASIASQFSNCLSNSAAYVVDESVQGNWGSFDNLSEYDSTNQVDQPVQEDWGSCNSLYQFDSANEIQHFSGEFNTQEQLPYFPSHHNDTQMLISSDLYSSQQLTSYQPSEEE